jgi:hypothetical protein
MKVMQTGIAAAWIFQPLPAGRKLLKRLLIGQATPPNQESDLQQLNVSITRGSTHIPNAIALGDIVCAWPQKGRPATPNALKDHGYAALSDVLLKKWNEFHLLLRRFRLSTKDDALTLAPLSRDAARAS